MDRLILLVMMISVIFMVRMLLIEVVCRIDMILLIWKKVGFVSEKFMISMIRLVKVRSFCCVVFWWVCFLFIFWVFYFVVSVLCWVVSFMMFFCDVLLGRMLVRWFLYMIVMWCDRCSILGSLLLMMMIVLFVVVNFFSRW